jgi:hypothetical protein
VRNEGEVAPVPVRGFDVVPAPAVPGVPVAPAVPAVPAEVVPVVAALVSGAIPQVSQYPSSIVPGQSRSHFIGRSSRSWR